MLAFNRRQFLIAGGLTAGTAVLLPPWLRRAVGGETAVALPDPAVLVAEQAWVFDLAFPAYFPVLPAVIDPTATPAPSVTAQPTASTTPTASATATPTVTAAPTATPTMTPTASATPDPLNNKIYLPLVAKEINP
ncbi:MAG: hypothetical protein R3D55_11880 [Chloroflexota bacterium]